MGDFYDNLNTIRFVEDGFWLCWRGGIIRKVYDDYSLSPILATATLSNSSMKDMFGHNFFHSRLSSIDNNSGVFIEGEYFTFDFPDLKDKNPDIPIPLDVKKISKEELFGLSYSEEQKKEIELRNKIIISVNDLTTTNGIIDALFLIEIRMNELDSLGMGHNLIFHITDKQDVVLEEDEFFDKAIQIDGAATIINSIVQIFNRHPQSESFYKNEEETGLCNAAYVLASKDEYLTTVLQYFAAVDLDHDVFNQENTLPYLMEKHSTDFLGKKMKAISEDLFEWFDYFYIRG